MTPEQILEDAIDVLQTHGWIQGKSGSRHDGFCAIGAVYQAVAQDVHGNVSDKDATAALVALGLLDIPHTSGRLKHPIAVWNDAPDRTAEDVILAMKKAARGES